MMRRHRVLATWLLSLLLLAACGPNQPTATPIPPPAAATLPPAVPTTASETAPTPPGLEGSGDVKRTLLTFDDLIGGFEATSPLAEEALALPDDAAPSQHVFEGRLELVGEETGGYMQVVQGNPDVGPEAAHLPAFDYEFVQSGSYLVPVQRGLVIADHPNWNLILGPGRIWQEDGDHGHSRASLPFALVWKGGNATFNGTMTFLFDGETVSRVWYQVTQETTSSLKADFFGLLEAAYHPGTGGDADQLRSAFAQELAGRFPTRPLDQLAEDYPGIDVTAFGRGVSPQHLTIYGFVIDGVNYVGRCPTRYGLYPHCEWMRATSYSTAKSAFTSVALMRLAQKYGPEVAGSLIKDYIPEHAASPGDWSRVTFNDTLDMATGNYRSRDYMVDEDGPQMGDFFEAQPYDARIAAAFDWPNSAKPGRHWVYRTSDTFILARAMHNYLQGQEGPEADIYQFVVDEVYRPLKVGPGAYTTLRTADDHWQGQAEGGYGQWWIHDDLAKIATLLNADAGQVDGVQVLHPDLLAAALQRDTGDRGVDMGQGRRYNNAFWASRYTKADGYDCEFWVPQMLGVSGNAVVLMPNGSTYYYFSDNREFTWDAAVRESNKIRPHCSPPPVIEATSAPISEPGVEGLTADEVATLRSLKQVDDYPLYVMHYRGDYKAPAPSGEADLTCPAPSWGCSLFAALGDPDNRLYGRNFDWEYSPALLLHTEPPDGYASVSMVDIAYFGFDGEKAHALTDLPLTERQSLLSAPLWPFDGMNEQGLVVGMAAVPSGNMRPDPDKETIGSLGIIREMLDHAANVDEAVAILQSYNVDMEGGPPLHYLVSDRSGRAVLLEFYRGKAVIIPNEGPWHQATNFLRASAGGSGAGHCRRYDHIHEALSIAGGRLDRKEAMDLLASVAQTNTQWSVVYNANSGSIDVVMGREYDSPRAFQLGR